MTNDESASISFEEGYTTKKWILFGDDEWTPPIYTFKIRVGKDRFLVQDLQEDEYKAALIKQREMPVHMIVYGRKRWWWFRDVFYTHSIDDSDPEVAKGLIILKGTRDEKRRLKALKVARAEDSLSSSASED